MAMWNLFKKDRMSDNQPQPLFKLENLETPLIIDINKILKTVSAMVLFSIAEESVFERLCAINNTMGLKYTCIQCNDEFIGIIYKAEAVISNIKIYKDNVSDHPSERIVTADVGGMAICMAHSYNREKTTKYESSISKLMEKKYGKNKSVVVFTTYDYRYR